MVAARLSRAATIIAARYRAPIIDTIRFSLLLLLLGWLLSKSFATLGYNWQWHRVKPFLFSISDAGITPGPLLYGLGVTLQISALSMVFAFLIGMFIALLRLSGSPVGQLLARGYLEIIRNTPLLIQIFFIYFVLG
ncbi:MAG: ABC transporter permease subunit, partial [Desulfofustis sp.]|nr:ABC transporter permease subunit [Desulfofustis sp.]